MGRNTNSDRRKRSKGIAPGDVDLAALKAALQDIDNKTLNDLRKKGYFDLYVGAEANLGGGSDVIGYESTLIPSPNGEKGVDKFEIMGEKVNLPFNVFLSDQNNKVKIYDFDDPAEYFHAVAEAASMLMELVKPEIMMRAIAPKLPDSNGRAIPDDSDYFGTGLMERITTPGDGDLASFEHASLIETLGRLSAVSKFMTQITSGEENFADEQEVHIVDTAAYAPVSRSSKAAGSYARREVSRPVRNVPFTGKRR